MMPPSLRSVRFGSRDLVEERLGRLQAALLDRLGVHPGAVEIADLLFHRTVAGIGGRGLGGCLDDEARR